MTVVRKLANWQTLFALSLLALGLNGLLQVGLQRDMAVKATQLKAQVATAEGLSGRMKDSVSGLQALRQATVQMQDTLDRLETTTGHMDQGLQVLSDTVKGISQDVNQLGQSTGGSQKALQTAMAAAQSLETQLSQLQSVNGDVLQTLSTMRKTAQAMEQDLQQMNAKTALIP